jgi:protease-4
MKKALIGLLALIGGLAILALFAVAFFGLVVGLGKPGVPADVVLQFDFEKGVIEEIPDDPIAQVMLQGQTPVLDVVDALDRASTDKRVRAFVGRIGGSGVGLAHIQEIRDAVARFRAAGKRAIAYSETFGEFGAGNGGYYLATAFDEIWLQPSGDVSITGLMYESPFVRGTLDKLGIKPQMDQRYEYKNAMNMFTERSYTEPHKRAMQELMDSQFGQIVRGISAGRKKTEAEVRALFDKGPFLGQEAIDAGLVDGLAYEDELYAKLRKDQGDDFQLLFLDKYLERAGRPHIKGTTIALVHGYGGVSRGAGGYSPVDGSVTMGSDSVVEALRTAIDDDKVKAIVFRVDSPGGSYVASDTIWRETKRAREKKKPLIVSMGNVAGSGGYFVAMMADKIVAQPGTITGSIGVLGGKMLTAGLWDKVGLSWDEVHTSRNSTMFTGTHPYDEVGWERFQAFLDRVYVDFTSKVAEGRKLPIEKVREIAKGRIWTGEDAKRLGLIDEVGGVDTALALARQALNLKEDEPVRVRMIPAPKTTFESLFGQKPDHRRAAVDAVVRAVQAVQPQLRLLGQIVGVDGERILSMAEVPQPR